MAFTVMFILYSHFNYTINQFHTVGYGGKRMADNYDNSDKDRRELLKLKQGLVDEKDSNIKETGYDVRMAQTTGEKTKNFLWYHKVMIVVGILLIALAAVIYAEFFVKKKPDITIYSLGNYAMSIRTGFEEGMSAYAPDFDNNGEHNVTIDQGVPDKYLGDVDLFDQIKNGKCQVFIGKESELKDTYNSFRNAYGQQIFSDLSEVTGESGYLINLKNTAYGKRMQIYSTEIYVAVRCTDDESERNAMQFVKNLYDGVYYKQN